MHMVTVFYDGLCGLCSREIAHYKKIAPDGIFKWVDVNRNANALDKYNIEITDALKELHVIDKNGVVQKGVKSFQVIWEQLPRWNLLSRLLQLRAVFLVADFIYKRFASWRFGRSAHCKIAMHNRLM